MVVTKEKLLAAVALGLSAMLLSGLRLPHADPIPEVFPTEAERRFRVLGGLPVVGPEGELELERDPFVVQDAWAPMEPEPLEVPAREAWLRALPGGPLEAAREPSDRVRIVSPPGPGTPAEVQK
ncbi:MAG: hypothetical protein KDD82_21430 [Planctomycetes bacterium]|nr:hypothetical protein [Planctomycetota bacterium]